MAKQNKNAEPISVHPVEVRGKDYPVELHPDGSFRARVGDRGVSAESLEALRTKLLDATRRQKMKIAVPFTMVLHGEARDGTATGTHAATGRVLVTWADGVKEQYQSYGTADVLRRLTPEEKQEVKRLYEASKVANKALKTYVDERALRMRDAIREAEEDEIEKMKAAEEASAAPTARSADTPRPSRKGPAGRSPGG
jgi:hypothetical protein